MNGPTTLVLLAAGDDQQKAAPLGLFVLVLLGVVCYFLFKSMSRHLKRVRDDFPGSTSPPPSGPASSVPASAAPRAAAPRATAPKATAPSQTEDHALSGTAGSDAVGPGRAGFDNAGSDAAGTGRSGLDTAADADPGRST